MTGGSPPSTGDAPDVDALRRQGLRLEYATIVWNALEFVVTLALGLAARSLALVAFGLDSLIELFASLVVVWHMRESPETELAGRNQRAMQLVAVAFGVLSVSLLAAATRDVVTGNRAESSPLGIAYLAVTALVMVWLARRKRATGEALGSEPLTAEAAMTLLDGALATSVLVALSVNTLFGWWWADPLAAAVVGLVALNEAREAWEESTL